MSKWAKIHNLKQAAKTLNFLTEHKIEQYADLTAKNLGNQRLQANRQRTA